jgi:hypothetical protein
MATSASQDAASSLQADLRLAVSSLNVDNTFYIHDPSAGPDVTQETKFLKWVRLQRVDGRVTCQISDEFYFPFLCDTCRDGRFKV